MRQAITCSKFFVILLTLMLGSHTVKSQVIIALLFGDKLNTGKLEFGLSGGMNISNVSGVPDVKAKTGLGLGLFFNIKLSDRWSLHPEASPKFPTGFSKMQPYSLGDAALDSLFQDGNVKRKIKNLALPLLVRYRIKGLLFAEAGPQIGLRTKAHDIFEKDDLTYKNDVEDQLTRFDVGLAFGLSQRFTKNIGSAALSLRYYAGLTDIDKLATGSQKNNVFQILVSIPVGVGKQKAEHLN